MDALSACGLGLQVNTTRNITVGIGQLTDALMGKREFMSFPFNQAASTDTSKTSFCRAVRQIA
ncbi:hypothetical protein [Nitrosospira multiformis]|uniref:hypothetical protein n=1 Tax=Nitrosospira multiformis TaxID=1231 RepID=UPI0009447CED|nr:hypothetical protein [Nitrosospira multiformis]